MLPPTTKGMAVLLAAPLMLACGSKKDDAEPAPADPAAPTAAPSSEPPAPPSEPLAPLAELPEDTGGHQAVHQWSATFGSDGKDAARGVALGPNGELALVGYFSGRVDFGAGPLTSAGATDGFVAVFDAQGKPLWSRAFGGEHEDATNAVAIDGKGNVVVVGQFAGSMTFGASRLDSAGSDDVFVVKFDPTGKPLWGRTYGTLDSDEGNAVAIDGDGNVIIAGGFRQDIRFGELDLITSAGGYDAFVAALTPGGEPMWSRGYGDEGQDTARGIAVDAQGHILLLVEFAGTVDFGGPKVTTHGNTDLAAVKLDRRGQPLWASGFGGSYGDIGTGIAVDGAGNVVATGAFDREITVEGETLKGHGDTDVFVVAFGPDGKRKWIRIFGAIGKDVGHAVAADRFGNVVVTGHFHDQVRFGDQRVKSAGNRDVFLLKLNPRAELLWVQRFGAADHDQGAAVAMDRDGNLAVAGIFRHAIELGGAKLTGFAAPDQKAPFADIFVARFARGDGSGEGAPATKE